MKLSVLLVLPFSASTAVAQPALTEPMPLPGPVARRPERYREKIRRRRSYCDRRVGYPVALIAAGPSQDENLQATFGFGAAIGMLVGPSLAMVRRRRLNAVGDPRTSPIRRS